MFLSVWPLADFLESLVGYGFAFHDAASCFKCFKLAVLVEFNDFFDALKDDFSASLTDAMIRDVFKMMDMNKDGILSASDLQLTYQKLGHHVTVQEAQEVLVEIDLDSDGLLYFDEFCAYVKKKDNLEKLLNVQRRKVSDQSESYIIEMEMAGNQK